MYWYGWVCEHIWGLNVLLSSYQCPVNELSLGKPKSRYGPLEAQLRDIWDRLQAAQSTLRWFQLSTPGMPPRCQYPSRRQKMTVHSAHTKTGQCWDPSWVRIPCKIHHNRGGAQIHSNGRTNRFIPAAITKGPCVASGGHLAPHSIDWPLDKNNEKQGR